MKAIADLMPSVRIAGYPALANGNKVSGLSETGSSTQLTTYGEVVEVSAIIATGDRTGVDMVWTNAVYGHFGIDLTGASGGLVRIDDIIIEDVTSVFVRDMMSMVDVKDFGAKGDVTTDGSAAFEAADVAANGRTILVSDGVFKLASDVTIESKIKFKGTVTQVANKRFILQKDYNYESYLNAFGDETIAF